MNAPKCVLIVDDEPNVRLMLRTALQTAGYRVLEAADGLEALSLLRQTRCDLILLDLRMPNVDGLSALYRLRERDDTTPVVVLTAHGSIPDVVTAMRLGAIDFLTKPMTPVELRAAVSAAIRSTAGRRLVRRRSSRSAASPAPHQGG
jgi:DNA-binding response OmpR family regulator